MFQKNKQGSGSSYLEDNEMKQSSLQTLFLGKMSQSDGSIAKGKRTSPLG